MVKKLLLLLIILFFVGFILWHYLNTAIGEESQAINFIVNKGESIKQVSQNLKQAKLIKSPLFFRYLIWRQQASIKAGEYLINPKLTTKEIINLLVKGEVINQETTIRIIEGWNIGEIEQYFKKNNSISNVNFLKLASAQLKNWPFSFIKPKFLNNAPATANLEGFLFPDTYRIFKDATAADAITKMLKNFDSKLTKQMRDDIAQQNKSIYQIIIMASLVEKEVRTSEDMQTVAGIFWNRIKDGQALESCATLAYILGEKKVQYSAADTQVDSPYNTYRNLGLPPGPIANPGLNSIKAAIYYPKYTQYNYFLSRPDTGETVYSKTLEEHNLNKYKYLK